jgi:hypothetical protein
LVRIKLLQAIVVVCIISACSSVHEKIGREHVQALNRWEELALSSDSSLSDYSVAITAQPTLEHLKNLPMFVVTNIGLSRTDNQFNLDLLRPEFEEKFLCAPVCSHFLEVYYDESGEIGTLPSRYFSNYEEELTDFYGELHMLNDRIEELRLINESRVGDYLTFLASQGDYFTGLDAFLKDLDAKLKAHEYISFLFGRTHGPYRINAESLSAPSTPDHGWLAQEHQSTFLEYEQRSFLEWENTSPESKHWETAIRADYLEN